MEPSNLRSLPPPFSPTRLRGHYRCGAPAYPPQNAQANTGDGGDDRCSAAFCEPAAGFDTSVGIPATFADTPEEASSEASGNLRAEYAACIGPVHHHTP